MVERAIRSVAACDRLIVVDGAYLGYPGAEKPWSTDGTLETAARIRPDAEIVECCEFWPSQHDKRTRYLRQADIGAAAGDWILVIDADEEAVGVEYLKSHLSAIEAERTTPPLADVIGWIICAMHRPKHRTFGIVEHRVFRWVPGLRYELHHANLLDCSGQALAPLVGQDRFRPTKWRSTWIPPTLFHFVHHKDDRDPQRLERQAVWYRTRCEPSIHQANIGHADSVQPRHRQFAHGCVGHINAQGHGPWRQREDGGGSMSYSDARRCAACHRELTSEEDGDVGRMVIGGVMLYGLRAYCEECARKIAAGEAQDVLAALGYRHTAMRAYQTKRGGPRRL